MVVNYQGKNFIEYAPVATQMTHLKHAQTSTAKTKREYQSHFALKISEVCCFKSISIKIKDSPVVIFPHLIWNKRGGVRSQKLLQKCFVLCQLSFRHPKCFKVESRDSNVGDAFAFVRNILSNNFDNVWYFYHFNLQKLLI